MRKLLLLLSALIALPSLADAPKYKISDTEMKIFVRYMNNIEQCIFPELTDNPTPEKIYNKWSKEDEVTMFYFETRLLEEIIGKEKLDILKSDKASDNYFNSQHQKFNHQIASVDKDKCKKFKPEYERVLALIKQSLK